jgi:hypothetical protein
VATVFTGTMSQSDESTEPTDDETMFLCPDCGIDAWGIEEDGQVVHEDFYVANELWDAVCPDDNVRRYVEDGVDFGEGNFVICIGCFERRLGRKLTREDLRVEPSLLFGVPPSKRYQDRWLR